MTYPEGTRLVVWVGGFAWNGQLLSGGMMQTDFWLQLFPVNVQCSDTVRESAAKCAEKMLAMLERIESGATIDDIDSELKALIAEAEGSK